MTDLSPETVERMVALVRAAAVNGVSQNAISTEAKVIVATLPEPVDPDLVEARRIAADNAYRPDTSSYERVIAGIDDASLNVKTALAAIKRGRALERGEAR